MKLNPQKAQADDTSSEASSNRLANDLISGDIGGSQSSTLSDSEQGSQFTLNDTFSSTTTDMDTTTTTINELSSSYPQTSQSSASPKKRGRKRKRKAVAVAPKKRGKKNGPTTRAQASVSKAIDNSNKKDQEKKSVGDGAGLPSKPTLLQKKNLREILKRNRVASDARVTRSASKLRTRGIAVNHGLTKIKLECDYIPPPKTEPADYDAFVDHENENMMAMDLNDLPEPSSPTIINVQSLNVEGSLPILSAEELSQEIRSLESKENNSQDLLLDNVSLDMKPDTDCMMDTSLEIIEELTGSSSEPETGNGQESTADLPTVEQLSSLATSGSTTLIAEESTTVSAESSETKKRQRKRLDLHDCTLCSFSGKKIVWHYANTHPDSTIPEACLDDGTYGGLISANISQSPQLLEIHLGEAEDGKVWPCLYCNDRFEQAREYYEHLTFHTGEFLYSCAVCSVKHPFPRTMANHMKSHKVKDTGSDSRNMITLYEPSIQGEESEIYGYLCNDCHYFQLVLSNLSSHLQEKNHSESDAMCIKLNIPKPPPALTRFDEVPATKLKSDPVFDASVFLGSDPESNVDCTASTSLPDVLNATTAIPASHLKEKDFTSPLLNDLISKSNLRQTYEAEKSEYDKVGESDAQIMKDCENALDWILSSLEYKVDENLQNKFNVRVKDVSNLPLPYHWVSVKREIKEEIDDDMMVDNWSKLDFFPPSEDEEEYLGCEWDPPSPLQIKVESMEVDSIPEKDVPAVCVNENSVMEASAITEEADLHTASISIPFPEVITLDGSDSSTDKSQEMDTTDKLELDESTEISSSSEPPSGTVIVTGLSGHNLYKCGNQNCRFTAPNPIGLKEHGYMCIFVPDTKEFTCIHCDRRVKSMPSLMEHLKAHGLSKLSCGLCAFKCCFMSELIKHVKVPN